MKALTKPKRTTVISIFIVFTVHIIFISCNMTKQQADLIVINGTVYTCDSLFTKVESFAVKDGKIIATGSTKDILSVYSSKNIYDAEGKFIYPGFYDAHCHFLSYGLNKELYADLSGLESVDEVIQRLKGFSENHNCEWIQGRGWNQNLWETKEFPTKEQLDVHFPDIPVYLTRIDGHAAWVNSKALEIAQINANTKVEGGKILLTNGQPNGVLIDEAMTLVRKHIPSPDQETKIKALMRAQEDCFAYGLTSVADAGLSVENIRLIDSLHNTSDLEIRIYAMLEPGCEGFDDFVKNGIYTTERLTVRSIKIYADGALGSRGACLLEDYSDEPGNRGVMVNTIDYMHTIARLAHEYGWQLCVHAIGDSANRQMLKLYADVLGGPNDLRWRIEHAQCIHPDDFQYFALFNIIPSIQTTHATSDMYWAEKRLGTERAKYAYAYKKLLELNGWLCNGTDFPVEQINPFLTFYSAVSRQDINKFPENGFQIENALSRMETLLSMTIWAAKAAFVEDVKGSIEAGKWADFIVLDQDLMETDIYNIPSMKVLETFVAGNSVYKK